MNEERKTPEERAKMTDLLRLQNARRNGYAEKLCATSKKSARRCSPASGSLVNFRVLVRPRSRSRPVPHQSPVELARGCGCRVRRWRAVVRSFPRTTALRASPLFCQGRLIRKPARLQLFSPVTLYRGGQGGMCSRCDRPLCPSQRGPSTKMELL